LSRVQPKWTRWPDSPPATGETAYDPAGSAGTGCR
jgi:hypothetical protein